MENQDQNTNIVSVGDVNQGAQPYTDQPLVGDSLVTPQALSLDAPAYALEIASQPELELDHTAAARRSGLLAGTTRRIGLLIILLLVMGIAVVLTVNSVSKKNRGNHGQLNAAANYGSQQIPLGVLSSQIQAGNISGASNVVINGPLTANNGFIITPSVQPNNPTTGQFYLDQNTGQLAYFNGKIYVPLGGQTTVQSLGGASGALTLGDGLRMDGNVLQNAGILTVTAGTGISATDDGHGNITIANDAVAGNVITGGGTNGAIALFNGSQTIGDSLLTQTGTTITVAGDLTLNTALSVGSGGTGAGSLAANGVVVANGNAPLASVTAVTPGLCLVSTAGAPAFMSCSGSASVTSLNGLTGALTVANATASGSQITINDATTTGKGIASFDGTNFTVNSGAVNTVQNISSTSSPTFAGVNTNTVTPSGSLTIGSLSQSFTVQGTSSSVFVVSGNGFNTTLGFTGTAVGNVNYNLDRSVSAGTYGICTTAGNCVGTGGGVTTPGGSTNRLSKFNGAQSLIDSSVSDDGTNVTVNGTANLVVQGGTATVGTLTQAGTLVLSDGNNHTAALVISGLAANRTYTIPDAGSNAEFCLSSGNCVGNGGTGAAPNGAEYLVAHLNSTLTDERMLAAGTNVAITDGGAGSTMTVATIDNPTFSTSVTTPLLQSSGALSITSAAGQTIAVDAGTTIELQDDTNVTGNFDVSGGLHAGTGNAFQVSAAGSITAATGISSSGTITFSNLNCSTNANGGALTTNGSGQLICSDDDGGSGGGISGSGTSGTVALFNGTQTITNSIITQSGTTITIAGDLSLNTALAVANGGTGVGSFTTNGVVYGNGTGAVQVTAAGSGGQVLVADASGVPTFMGLSGDIAVSNTGVVAIQPNAVALGTDTTGNYIATLGTLTGLSTSGNTGEGSTPTLSVNYGSIANTAVQGNVTLNCAAGTGNLTGGGTAITLGTGGSCGNISIVNNPSFSTSVTSPSFILTGAGQNGTVQVGNLGQGTVYTLPDPGAASATICLSTGNCGVTGSAGGDLTGTYPNPTIAKLQGTNLTIAGPSAGQVLVYNGTNGRWENHDITGDVAISETGVAAIQANSVALGADTTGNYVLGVNAGTGTSVSGSAGEGWTPTVSVLYGSTSGTAVEGNQTISVSAGTNLTGGGSITLGAGGSVTLNVASSPTFAGTLTVQGATATIGTTSQAGGVVLSDGSSNTATVGTASLGQNTTFTFPDPGASNATICLSTGNCAGAGGGVLTGGGTADRLTKFTGSQAIADSSVSDDGSTVTLNGSVNLVVQGGTSTLGTTTQGGTLTLSDGSAHTVSIVASGLSADRVYTLPDAGGNATLCVTSGNCIGGTGGAPNGAPYLVASLDGTLTSERALAVDANMTLNDGGANGSMTVGIISNPSFSTSVTTPILQSSGALTISSAAGQTVAIDAGTTIELQDSTNVTGNLDVSGSITSGNANAFQINASGAITAATGITSSGTITFSGLNCSTNANGGTLTTNGSGQLVCSDDDGGSGSAISGSGTSGTITMFNGTQTITNSIITQSGTTVTIAGDLALNTALSVANGGTGAGSFTSKGLLYGNGTGALQVTAAGTSGQVLVAGTTGTPAFVTFSGDVAVSNTGATAIQADSVALGTDTTGNYIGTLGSLTGLSTTGNTGEGSTPTLSVNYGSIANTAVQGNVTLTCASGTGNLSGGGTSITLGAGGSCGSISTVNNPTFSTSVTTPSMILTGAGSNGTVQVGALGQSTVYTLPDPGAAAATICLSTGNCAATGSAGGDLTGTYPNPTIAKLQGTNLTISGPTAGQILVYNGTNGRWENHGVSGDIAISEAGVATVQANSVTLGTDTTGNYVLGVSAGTGVSVSGAAGEGWTPTIAVVYGSGANTAVEGNTSISVTAGTNLSGGGSITLGSGGSVTLNVASSPIFSGTLTVQGATATIGTTSQAGGVVLSDGSSNTGTIQTASLGQNTTFTLPDPGASSATICLNSGNCAGSGTGVTTSGGTLNRLSKFTAAQALGDSSISDDGSTVTINGTANLVVQGGTSTLGTTTQAGTLVLSDGSSNIVSIVAGNFSANHAYTLPDVGSDATICLSTGNCVGGGGGSAPSDATYLVTSLNGSLSNERALDAGNNIAFTDAGANGNFTVATVQNPTFTTSVTTPILQSSGALTISSAAGQIIAINSGASIELQDSTNITGDLDVSVGIKAGTADAFRVTSAGAIAAATGITSSGTITFSGLNCSVNANGGTLTTDSSGQLICSDDDGGAASTITGTGTSGTITMFNGTQTIANSIITQSGTTVTIAGDLTLNTQLSVANGGTGATSFTSKGIIFGSGTGALQVTAAGTSGQVLVAGTTGTPAFVTFSGDVAVSNTGTTTIQADSVALGTDTTGNFVSNLGTLTGLSTSGNTGEGSTPTLSVTYGSLANTAVQGNVTLTCPSGSGNLTGGGTAITLGTGGSCGSISMVNNPTFSTSVTSPSLILTGAGSNGTVQVGNLGQGTVYTLPDPGGAAATICLSTGNCATSGSAGGDLTGTYPNPTIAKLQGTNLTIAGPSAGQVLVYNGTNGRWENHGVSGDIVLAEDGTATVQANSVALGTDTTGNYVATLGTLTGLSTSGNTGEGSTPTISVAYGSGANTAVQGNTSITVSPGTNLSGGGSITLGSGGSVTLNVASSPTFSGTLAVQGATVTIGANSQQGSVVLSDGAATSKTATIKTGGTLGQNTTFNLPDPGAASATICLTTGNCAGSGTGVTTSGGTTNRLSKFTGAQAIGDSSISDTGSAVTINGSVNLVVQGGTSTLGTTSQAGTLTISDGSSNTISIVAAGTAADRVYTLPDVGGTADFCLSTGNCVGGAGGSAPSDATYLVATLNGSLSNERALAGGTNISLTDGGANGSMTVATVNNPSFSTSVTTPILQSSGALTISSAAGQTVAIDAGTTIELQDSTNVTGNIDISGSFTSGTSNAFTISSAGAITAATGIASSGTITFSGLNCTANANGGTLTTNGSGQLTCSDDDGPAANTVTGTGTTNTVALFSGTHAIGDSVISQSGTAITIAGSLALNTQLSVANGGTGATNFTSNGIVYGNTTGALQVTAAGTSGQVLVAGTGGTPAFVTFSGDVAVNNTGTTTIQANSVALGTDTTGNYVATLGTLTGLSTTGNTGEGSTPTLSVTYGSGVSTAVQGNTTLTCPSGTGNLTGGGTSITLGVGGTCGAIDTVASPTFSGTVTVQGASATIGTNSVAGNLVLSDGAVTAKTATVKSATLGQNTTYTLPDPGGSTASFCLSTGNCTALGTAGGDLTGSFPNPTIAKLQGGALNITSVAAGNMLIYNGTNGRWENHGLSGDVAVTEAGVATIQGNSVALTTDTTGNYVAGLTAGNGISVTGSAGEGWSPTVNVVYGSSTNTAVQGNTSITVTAGTNLSGGGSITLGTGGTVTLNVSNAPAFTGSSVTVGTASVQGTLVLDDGSVSPKTATIKTTSTLGQNTTYNLPDPGTASATICLQNSTSCGFAPSTGGTGYIQNQSAGQQASSSFWISGTGRADTSISTPQITTASGNLTLQPASGVVTLGGSDTFTANGGFSIFSGSNSNLTVTANGSGTLNLGTNAASSRIINIGATGSQANTSTINIGNSTAAAQTISIGSTNGASATTISAGTGNLLLQTNSATASITAKAGTDSSTAFQIQDAASTSMFNVDTIKNVISINSGTGSALTSFSALSSTLTTNTSFAGSFVANGYLYVVGGHGASPSTAVESAPIKSDGTLGTFTAQTSLIDARDYAIESVTYSNNIIYVVGGTNTGNNSDYEWGVLTARVTSGGGVTAWEDTGLDITLPTSRYGISALVANGYLYAIGGVFNNGGTQAVSTEIAYGKLAPDGQVTKWVTTSVNLPSATAYAHMSSAFVNGKIFLMGGANAAGTSQTQVYYATPDPSTGDITSWTANTNSLPAATSNSTAIPYNGYMYIINGGNNAMYVSQISTTGQPLGAWSTVSLSPMTGAAGRFSAMYNGYFYVMGGGATGSTSVYYASAARTQIKGALDLIGNADGIVGGDGPVGGSLTAGNTSVVGTLNVQGNANFSQGASVTDNLTVMSTGNGMAGLSLISDLDNDVNEDGGSFINMAVDGNGTMGTMGVTQHGGFSPDGIHTISNSIGNAMVVGSLLGSGSLQLITANYDSVNAVTLSTQARLTVMAGTQSSTATHVCVNVTTCTRTLGVLGTIGATGTINGSGAFNTTGGADMSEYIHADPDVAVADVVMADPNNTERVVKTTSAYEGAAVGVIADPDHSGFVSNVYSDFEGNTSDPGAKPLTLAGRVYVKVTDEGGAVKPGDYLTSSSTPGKAMKATHAGPTIGKALGFYDGTGGDGTVLALINVSYYAPSMQGSNDGSFGNLNASGKVNIGGDLTVTGLASVGTLLVNGHIVTAGTTPLAAAQAAAGSNATVTVTGNDIAGRIEITTGDTPIADDLAKLTFNTPYSGAPQVVITPFGKGSALTQPYVDDVDVNSFMIGTSQSPQPHTTYVFMYHVLGTGTASGP